MRVVIVGGDYAIQGMFESKGFKVISNPEEADMLCFTGGNDVSPSLYGESNHPSTGNYPKRDKDEIHVYSSYNVPCVGICRGGQFLNVMNGGKLYQHVYNHAIGGTHEAIDILSGKTYQVTSTHHQMMRPSLEGEVILYSEPRGPWKEYMKDNTIVKDTEGIDVEAVWYKNTKCLCFQPHPEFHEGSTRDLFFNYIERLICAEL